MARSRGGRIDQPHGEKISVSPEERATFKRMREANGWSQDELAAMVHVSNGTISNLETGRHGQVYKSTYAEILRVLKLGKKTNTEFADERFKRIVAKLVQLDERGQLAVEALADAMLTSQTKTT